MVLVRSARITGTANAHGPLYDHISKGDPMTRGKTRTRSKTMQARGKTEAVGPETRGGSYEEESRGEDDDRATGEMAGLSEDVLDLRQDVMEDAARGIGREGRENAERERESGPARDPTGNEVENGPQVDPADPNLSAVMAEAGAQEDQASLGMAGDDERMQLDDPERLS